MPSVAHNLLKAAQIGWFRLRLNPDSSLVNKLLALLVTQQGASEINLEGKLIHRLGKVSMNPAEEVIYNPKNTPLPVALPNKPKVVLAVQYASLEKTSATCSATGQDNTGWPSGCKLLPML